MADVQKQFTQFHDAIKQKRFEDEQVLRDKRDIVRKKLDDNLPAVFEKYGEEVPTWTWRDQGSYEMGTGTKPLSGDFDIDQGLYFSLSVSDVDPVTLKKRVHEALDGHTKNVEVRQPCVTVWYHKANERVYHVDIAVYSEAGANWFIGDQLAVGRLGSSEENKGWEASDPKGLSDEIFERFGGEDRKQFRREVRYLKRWKDHKFSSDGNAAPNGIGLTVAAYHWLTNEYVDEYANGKDEPDDLAALLGLVKGMLGRFTSTYHEGAFARRLAVELPTSPYSDLFAKMTNVQMGAFEEKLEKLRDALEYARDEVDPVDACKRLRKEFGDDFPVPEKKSTARATVSPISSSSNAA
ncbi:MAG: cyclic GMP-AMP synthase DncV-like nucleotidyltransferase [Rhodothermales bacterium]